MDAESETKKGIAADVLIVILGGRKLAGLIVALLAVLHAPPEAYATIAMLYGMFVTGNGVEHYTRKGEATPSRPASDDGASQG